MKYSVLIPVYNVEKYLEECIRSVLQQTYRDYEIVLVDDGSSDTSPEICDRFRKSHPDRVKVVHKINEGVMMARNDAIRHSAGDVVVFLDSDDCLRADALMRIHEAFEKHQCHMVIYNYSTDSDFGRACAAVPFADDTCMEAEDKKQLYRLLCDVSYLNGLCFKAVKREVAELLLDCADWRHVTNGEDLLCTLPLVTRAERIVYLDQALYYYRQRPESAVRSFKPNMCSSFKIVHQEFERYIDLWHMPELHARHHAKEVKGWAVALELCLENRQRMGKDACRAVLQEMAEDPYFRNAYEQMDASQLSKYKKMLAGFLYRRRYTMLFLIQDMLLLGRALRGRTGNSEQE